MKKTVCEKDYEYVFVYKLQQDWAQLPPPVHSQKKKPFRMTVLVNLFALSLKKALGL